MNWRDEEIQALDHAFDELKLNKHDNMMELTEDEELGECVMIPVPVWETFEQEIRLHVTELVYRAHGQFEEIQRWEERQEIWRDLIRTMIEAIKGD